MGTNRTSSTVHLSPASVSLICRKQARLNSFIASGDSVGLASQLHRLPGSTPPLWSWHSSTGKWKLARLYNWLSNCRLEHHTSMRDESHSRAGMAAVPTEGSTASSGGREIGMGARLRSSLVNVSLRSSTELVGLVISSLSTMLASLRRMQTDSVEDLKTKQKY